MFAIDITSTAMGVPRNVLWDIVPSEHMDPVVVSDLGNVLQPGIIGSVKDVAAPNGNGRWVYMVGNGYDSVSQQATLFVFDAFSGSLIKAMQTGVGSAAPASAQNGLGGITPVFDGTRNIVAVYGGDKLGNMWKFDFSSGNINDPDGGGPPKGWEIYNKSLESFPRRCSRRPTRWAIRSRFQQLRALHRTASPACMSDSAPENCSSRATRSARRCSRCMCCGIRGSFRRF